MGLRRDQMPHARQQLVRWTNVTHSLRSMEWANSLYGRAARLRYLGADLLWAIQQADAGVHKKHAAMNSTTLR